MIELSSLGACTRVRTRASCGWSQLSTGQVVWSRSFPSGGATVIDVVASHDGTSVAVGKATCCPNSGFTTTVYGAGGGQVGTFDGHAGGYTATPFLWDGFG